MYVGMIETRSLKTLLKSFHENYRWRLPLVITIMKQSDHGRRSKTAYFKYPGCNLLKFSQAFIILNSHYMENYSCIFIEHVIFNSF